VASSLAVQTISGIFAKLADKTADLDSIPLDKQKELLHQGIQQANLSVFQRGNSDANLQDMGTTIAATLFRQDYVIWAHVGDSRIYRLRDGALTQITFDHSWVGELQRRNLITKEEAMQHPLKNIITRALGMERSVNVDISSDAVARGDVYLLCSDGLTDLVEDDEIETVLIENGDTPKTAAERLIDLANSRGGLDNITVGIAHVA
jgi:protein phosphatase